MANNVILSTELKKKLMLKTVRKRKPLFTPFTNRAAYARNLLGTFQSDVAHFLPFLPSNYHHQCVHWSQWLFLPPGKRAHRRYLLHSRRELGIYVNHRHWERMIVCLVSSAEKKGIQWILDWKLSYLAENPMPVL